MVPPPSVGATTAVSPSVCPAVMGFGVGVRVTLVATGGGGEPYVKLSARVGAEPPEAVVTVTSTRSAKAAAGATACTSLSDIVVICVEEAPPKPTEKAPARWLPLIVTTVPPASGPLLGPTDSTTGLFAVT